LLEEGTSFRELIDELRAQVAIKYVRDTDLSIEDITGALGFHEASAFRRAFRRWTGSAPTSFGEPGPSRFQRPEPSDGPVVDLAEFHRFMAGSNLFHPE